MCVEPLSGDVRRNLRDRVEILDLARYHRHRGVVAERVGVDFVAAGVNDERRVAAHTVEVLADLRLQNLPIPLLGRLVCDEIVLHDHNAEFVAETVEAVVLGHTAAAPDSQQLYSGVLREHQRPAVVVVGNVE